MVVQDIGHQADELIRYYGELDRRLSQTGVKDVHDILNLYNQLRRALDVVSFEEIDWALAETRRVIEALTLLEGNLHTLKKLKTAFAGI